MTQKLTKAHQEFIMQMFIDYEEAMKRRLEATMNPLLEHVVQSQAQIVEGFEGLIRKKEAMEELLDDMVHKEQELAKMYHEFKAYIARIDAFLMGLDRKLQRKET